MSNNDIAFNNNNTRYYNNNDNNTAYSNPVNGNNNTFQHHYNSSSNPYNHPPSNADYSHTNPYSNDSLQLYSNQSLQLYNFTIEQVVIHHAYTAVLINRSITPIWYFIGLIGNSMSIAVWLQKTLRKDLSSAVYFVALSISDIIMLLLHMLQELSNAWFINALGFPVLCEVYAVFYLAGQYLAPIFVFCFTIDRYIAICFPFKKNTYCTPRQALKVVLLVVLLCILLCAVQGYFWHYDPLKEECSLRDNFIFNPSGTLWFHWTTATESLIFFVIPVLNLITNVRVIKEIYKISESQEPPTTIITRPRSSSHPHHSSDQPNQLMASLRSKQLNNAQLLQQRSSLLGRLEPGADSRSSLCVASDRTTFPTSPRNSYSVVSSKNHGTNPIATNVMLLSVSFYVIFTTLPPAIIYAVETMYPEGLLSDTNHSIISNDVTWKKYFTFLHIKAVVYEICISHYACNFFIFILTGRKFRDVALSTFFCRKRQPTEDDYNSNNVGDNSSNNNNDSNNKHNNNRKVSQLSVLSTIL